MSKFMSWEDFHRHFPKKDMKAYINEKEKFRLDQKLQSINLSEYEEMIYAVPLRNENCKTFREMLLNMTEKDVLFCSQHHVICSACLAWYATIYKPQFIGVELWKSGI